jgi:hypothetical protein
MADELRTWLPECPIELGDSAVCELIPCGHFISLAVARNYARLIRDKQSSANPDKCPMCRTKWNEIRCLSDEKSVEKIRSQLEAYTRDIPEGPLKVWFQQILHFFISRNNALDEDLTHSIGECLVNTFIKRDRDGQSILILSNNNKKIIELIECVRDAINNWISRNIGDRKTAIDEQKANDSDSGTKIYEGSPLQWLLEKSDELSKDAINQAQSSSIALQTKIISVDSILRGIEQGISSAKGKIAQVPEYVAMSALATAVLIGASSTYSNIDIRSCERLSTVQERGPDVPLKGKWTGFEVCEDRLILGSDLCCDPRPFISGAKKGACGTEEYHLVGPNEYSGPEIAFKDKRQMEPGRYHNCDVSTSGKCLAQNTIKLGLCAISGEENCDTSGGLDLWETAKGAKFKPTEYGPGPFLPSEKQVCQSKLSTHETVSLVAAVASLGVLLYGVYKVCTSPYKPPTLLGDDTLIITSDGKEHQTNDRAGVRGGASKTSRKIIDKKLLKKMKRSKKVSKGGRKTTHKKSKKIKKPKIKHSKSSKKYKTK